MVKKRRMVNLSLGISSSKWLREQKSREKTALGAGEAEVQSGSGQPSGAVNRKQSNQASETKPEWLTSDNGFRFHFIAAKMDPAAAGMTLGTAPSAAGAEQKQAPEQENLSEALSFAASGQEPKFSLEDHPPAPLGLVNQRTREPPENAAACEAPGNSLSPESPGGLESLASQKPEEAQTADSATGEDRGRFTSNSPVAESAPGEEAAAEEAAAAGAAQKKKKKKKQKASSSKKEKEEPEISRKTKAEASRCLTKDASHQDETAQQSEDQLRKEVDWCVEQLELGLKTQKPTPKQAEEALRAIRTLRSDKAPLVKKRQVMRTLFGDYRKRMEEDWCQQLKLMQTAMKSARIVEVKEDIRRKSCQVVRKRSGACRKRQDSAESPSTSPRTSNTNSFKFTSSQENFYFNFF